MKAKSMKLRLLVTLHALFKHSDEKHRMNTTHINKYLKPYGLDCTSRVLADTVGVMREFGIDVGSRGIFDNQGIWLKDRPLQDADLNALVFAVTTNPHISKAEAERILSALKPMVTVYQEDDLVSYVETGEEIAPADISIYEKYAVICNAIKTKRRVRYRSSYLKYDKETGTVYKENQWPTIFTPKHIIQRNGKLYMAGFNNTDERNDTVDLDIVSEIKLAFKHKDPKQAEVKEILDNVDFMECMETTKGELIYEGEAVFKCSTQYLDRLFELYGKPDVPLEKNNRFKWAYHKNHIKLYSKTLAEFAEDREYDVRITGPEALIKAVKDYYEDIDKILYEPVIPSRKRK